MNTLLHALNSPNIQGVLSGDSSTHIRAPLKTRDNLPELREVRTLGETVAPDVRLVCREAWGDMYSSQEVGYIALQCPDHEDCYHVQSESLLVEVVDDAGRPCAAGEIGRVLLTTLHNFAMPLIRYEVGDYAEVGSQCSCGRGLPVLKRIMGRVRNMVVMPTGEKRWPDFGFRHYGDIALIDQFQMVQKSRETIEMRLVVPRPVNPQEEQRLTEVIQAALGYPFQVTFTYLLEIPRTKGGKFEDFISEVTS